MVSETTNKIVSVPKRLPKTTDYFLYNHGLPVKVSSHVLTKFYHPNRDLHAPGDMAKVGKRISVVSV